MAELTSEERVLCALRRDEPDRVPHFEWLVDRKVRSALCPGCKNHNDFAVRMGHDAVLVDPDFRKEPAGAGRWLSEWGYITQDTDEEHGIEVESPIQTLADLERYTPPDLHAAGRYASIERALIDYPGKAVIVHLNDVFSLPRYWMGMENLLIAIAADPELVSALVDLSVELNLAMAREVAGRGVRIVYTGDDYAGNLGPLMSPRHFRKLFYPGLCRVMGGFQRTGAICDQAHRRQPVADHRHDRGLGHRLPGPDRPAGWHGPG
jgi:hypothetical protein